MAHRLASEIFMHAFSAICIINLNGFFDLYTKTLKTIRSRTHVCIVGPFFLLVCVQMNVGELYRFAVFNKTR